MGSLITFYCPACERIARTEEDVAAEEKRTCSACGARLERLDGPPPKPNRLWPVAVSTIITIIGGLVISACIGLMLYLFFSRAAGKSYFGPLWGSYETIGAIASISLGVVMLVWIIPAFIRPRQKD